MAFDINAARKAGYNDAEIADFLGKQHDNFDVQGAIKAGYSVDEIAARTSKADASPQPKSPSPASTIMNAAINATPGIGQVANLSEHFNKLSPEVQKAALTAVGAEAGLPLGPAASGAASATLGGLTEAAQNPIQATKALIPMVQSVMAPTPNSMAQSAKVISSPEGQDFMKRRAIEAGTAAASGAALKAMRGVTASGPVSAGVENPSLVFKSTRDEILHQLGMAKGEAMTGENLVEGQRLMRFLRSPAGQGKLADEAIKAVEDGTKLSNTQLMAYNEALGKVQTKGGTFTDVYNGARKAIQQQLKEQAPVLVEKKALARKLFLSMGQGEAATSLIKAIQNPVSTAATMPGAQRAAGAAVRVGSEALFPGFVSSSDLLSNSLQQLANSRKKAKGR